MPPEFFRTGDGDPNESLTGYDPSYDIKEQLKNHQQTPRRTKEILELANSNYDSFRYHLLKGSDCEAEITLDVIAGIYVEFDKSLTVYHPYVFGCDSQTKKQLYEAIYNINQPNLPPDPENPDHDLYILRKNERNFARSGKPICALIIGHDDNSPDKEQYILMATVNGLSAQNALKALADSVKPELDLYNRFSN
jgi:ferritin-like protein